MFLMFFDKMFLNIKESELKITISFSFTFFYKTSCIIILKSLNLINFLFNFNEISFYL